MTSFATLEPVVRSIVGDSASAVFTGPEVSTALQAAYGDLLVSGFEGTYTVDSSGITPDLDERGKMLFCLAASCILLGGRLSDPSLSMSVKSEETAYDGKGGADALKARLGQLRTQMLKAILDGGSAVVGHDSKEFGLALPDDSPLKGSW